MKIKHKVWFGRARGIAWLLLGVVSVPLGWAESVALVWAASVYANAESGFATAEGSDDRAVLDAIARVRPARRRPCSRAALPHRVRRAAACAHSMHRVD